MKDFVLVELGEYEVSYGSIRNGNKYYWKDLDFGVWRVWKYDCLEEDWNEIEVLEDCYVIEKGVDVDNLWCLVWE